jgi:hypothetical protein
MGFAQRLSAGSRAEAVRKGSDALWARDLALASRAAQRIDASLAAAQPDVRGAFALAMSSLVMEHELNRASAAASTQPSRTETDAQAARIHAAATEARQTMRHWADEQHASTTAPATHPTEMAVLEANAAAAEKHPQRADQLDQQRQAPATAPAIGATTRGIASSNAIAPSVQLPQSQALSDLEQRQRKLRSETTRRNVTTQPALADAQASLARDVEEQARRAEEGSAEASIQQLRETRRKLTEMEGASSPDAAKDAASLAQALRRSTPEAGAAADVIEKQLVPALTPPAVPGSSSPPATAPAGSNTGAPSGGGTGGGAAGSAQSSRAKQAFQQARRALIDAEKAVSSDEPLAAAAVAARDAQTALQNSNSFAARAAQEKAASLLAEARRRALEQEARDRLQEVPALAALLRGSSANSGGGGGSSSSRDVALQRPALPREWGGLRERRDADLIAPGSQPDPPEFQDALQAYFKALNRAAGTAGAVPAGGNSGKTGQGGR